MTVTDMGILIKGTDIVLRRASMSAKRIFHLCLLSSKAPNCEAAVRMAINALLPFLGKEDIAYKTLLLQCLKEDWRAIKDFLKFAYAVTPITEDHHE